MKDRVQSGMAPARGATTMTRMPWLAKPYHGSGRACPCHVSPTSSPTSRIRHQYPKGWRAGHRPPLLRVVLPPTKVGEEIHRLRDAFGEAFTYTSSSKRKAR